MRATYLLCGVLLFATLGCEDQACVPGESQACTGPGGCMGGQRCNDEGTAFEACLCEGDMMCGGAVCTDPMACCGGTACTNTDTDPMNCGSCGNVCSGSTCVGGSCGITLMDSGT